MTSPRRVAVTGGARGIGLAIAGRFAEDGAAVTILDRDPEQAALAAAALPRATWEALDVTDEPAVADYFERTASAFDVVVANAGISGPMAPVIDVDPHKWRHVLDVNLNGVFYTLRSAARRMVRDQVRGNVIVTASVAGLTAEANAAHYCASKWAVIGLLKSAAVELAEHGIRVNGVCPGDVDTGLLAGMVDADAYHGPAGRLARPEEVAHAYAWLADPRSSFVSGATIVVDGGLINSALVH
jgi:NAD(P)-dependent dehydrogenase (short-subunit alcohol dehydrogenase family)